jgi:hypothetical protein
MATNSLHTGSEVVELLLTIEATTVLFIAFTAGLFWVLI